MTGGDNMEIFGEFTALDLPMSIHVEKIITLHYFKYSRNFSFSGEKHDFWEIAYADHGEVGIAAEKQRLDLQQGEAVFHKPNEYHNIWSKNNFANVIILSFVCKSPGMKFFENKIIKLNEEQKGLLGKILSVGEIYFDGPDEVCQTKLYVSSKAPFGCGQMIKNYIELMLLSMIQESSMLLCSNRATSGGKRQGESAIVGAVCQMLTEHLYCGLSMKDILSKVCFSKSYLSRIFREHTGSSIMNYYMNLKIEEAKRLISEEEYSLTEISEKLKFCSIHYFSYSFKKRTGMTPSEYKRTVGARAIL